MDPLLPSCPVCASPLPDPVEFCRRCGCHVLLVLKIRKGIARLEAEEDFDQDEVTECNDIHGRQHLSNYL
jgi:hypothetical protein